MAKELATHFGHDKTDVNSMLYANRDIFHVDEKYRWFLKDKTELKILLPGGGWLNAASFEDALTRAGSPLDSSCPRITFVLGEDCKLMLDALARLLALSNQLVLAGREVTIDFSESKPTLTYFNRIGFFDNLSTGVVVVPKRPRSSLAAIYEGNNQNVVELKKIDQNSEEIPVRLWKSFVQCAGQSYSTAAFTVLTEQYGNVIEHSGAATGFAGLQSYQGGGPKQHIQTVISDNGHGIVKTLQPALERSRPEVLKRLAKPGLHPGVALLQAVFEEGGLSCVSEPGRGLGLKKSGDWAEKFRGTVSVRQEDFELQIHYSPGRVNFSHSLKRVRLKGTHICFDFPLDQSR